MGVRVVYTLNNLRVLRTNAVEQTEKEKIRRTEVLAVACKAGVF